MPSYTQTQRKDERKMHIDLWYANEKIVSADCFFYPNDGVYRGNLYNENGRPIGDYWATDSRAIEKRFPDIFNGR